MLAIAGVDVFRGARRVVEGFGADVAPGEVTALLGANGAGKSSLALGLAGRLPIASGAVTIDGNDAIGRKPHQIRRLGLAVIPEGHHIFPKLSIRDNLRAAVIEPSREQALLDDVYGLLPELAAIDDRLGRSLSGGQQQMVAIAQALMSEPKYVLIDELSLGLAPIIVSRLVTLVDQIARTGVGVILIEQFTAIALRVAQHAIVLQLGHTAWSGTACDLGADPSILQAIYLGPALAIDNAT